MSPKSTTPQPLNHAIVLSFMIEYGRAYLSTGGPTSRLEENLSILGRKLGYPTEVFATPTGIFVGCVDTNGENRTAMARIKDGGINLGKLCWLESIFEDVVSKKLSIDKANRILNGKTIHRSPYKLWHFVLASFLSGFALSYPAFRVFPAALASGAISTATWWIVGPGLSGKVASAIFRDFIGCTVTLGLAAFCQLMMPAPFEAYAIGGLIVLVPGLALTTAIAELADQNLVSGTAKLMQAILTLLALGLAYMLFHNLSESLHLLPDATMTNKPMGVSASALGVALSVACFGILFKVPPKSLIWSSLTGLLGWSILRQFNSTQYMAAASYLASLSVGMLSMWLGSTFKVPSQVYSVPGIIAMLPGMLALTSFRSFAMGEQSSGLELAFKVALTAGSIVFGLFTARIPFALLMSARWPIPQKKS